MGVTDGKKPETIEVIKRLRAISGIIAILAKTEHRIEENEVVLKIVCHDIHDKQVLQQIKQTVLPAGIFYEVFPEDALTELKQNHEVLYEFQFEAGQNKQSKHAKDKVAYELISYSLSGLHNVVKIQVSRRVNGYTSRKTAKGETKEYTYPGLKDEPNVILVSESTVLMPEGDLAEGFTDFLTRKLVNYTKRRVWMEK